MKPQYPEKRIGWKDHPFQNDDDVRDLARAHFLQAVQACEPAVLGSLAALPNAQRASIDAWAARWHLTAPWCLGYARGTLELWTHFPQARGRFWGDDETRQARFVPDTERPVGHALKEPEHFVWLARFQVQGHPFMQIAERAERRRTVELAIKRLAAWIELPLRSSPRGGARTKAR